MEMRIEFNLAFATKKADDADVFVGYCPLLKLYSQGRTEPEAEEAVVSAATLFIGACYERDILHNILRERGLKKTDQKPDLGQDSSKQYIAVGGFSRTFEHSVPLELLSLVGEEAVCQ